jgi:hypothetical protein
MNDLSLARPAQDGSERARLISDIQNTMSSLISDIRNCYFQKDSEKEKDKPI